VDFCNRHPILGRGVAAILAALNASACVSWLPVRNADSYVTAQRPSSVRVTLVNNEQVNLYHPIVVDSQLVGRRWTEAAWTEDSIPLRQVKSVEVAYVKPGGLIAGIAVAALIVAALVGTNLNFGFGGLGGLHE